jgi:hypothetical protein
MSSIPRAHPIAPASDGPVWASDAPRTLGQMIVRRNPVRNNGPSLVTTSETSTAFGGHLAAVIVKDCVSVESGGIVP